MSRQLPEISDEDWKEIVLRLQAYTRMLVRDKGWFRGSETGAYISGKEIDDYVFEAIGRYLKNPEKHDPSKRTLVEYLKKHIIRTLVNNDLVSSENQTSTDLFSFESETENEDGSDTFIDAMLPKVDALYDDEIDYISIMNFIESEAKGDAYVENIFLGLNCGMKRADIIDEFRMSPSDYDNAMRRLITIRKKAAQKYNIIK